MNEILRAAGGRVVEDDGAVGAGFGVGARVEEFFAVVRERRLGAVLRGDFANFAEADDDFRAGDVGDRGWQLEFDDVGREHGGDLVFVVGVGLIVDLREKFGGDAGATVERAELSVLRDGAERVFRGGVVGGGASLAREMDADVGAGGGIFRAIGPRRRLCRRA